MHNINPYIRKRRKTTAEEARAKRTAYVLVCRRMTMSNWKKQYLVELLKLMHYRLVSEHIGRGRSNVHDKTKRLRDTNTLKLNAQRKTKWSRNSGKSRKIRLQ